MFLVPVREAYLVQQQSGTPVTLKCKVFADELSHIAFDLLKTAFGRYSESSLYPKQVCSIVMNNPVRKQFSETTDSGTSDFQKQ
ncbi:hypothetical protein TNCV_1307971 [Trichonephila clavipes]|nr:hypothetical protein TNCV_1307971 [Trichonephila clavipes]